MAISGILSGNQVAAGVGSGAEAEAGRERALMEKPWIAPSGPGSLSKIRRTIEGIW